jgi:glycosyltransferase involved in cell wall biosynthesis
LFDSHENYGEMLRSAGASPLLYIMARWLERTLAKRVDAILCISTLEAQRFKNIKAQHVYIVGNYQEAKTYNFCAGETKKMRDTLGISSERALVICYIGQLDRIRCLDALLEAIEGDDGLHLILAGWGIEAPKLLNKTASMPNVHFLGYLEPRKVPQYVHASDILYSCLSHDYRQIEWAMPNKLSQAMLAGKPIIATARGEMAKIIREEDCGILLPIPDSRHVRDSLIKLKDRDLRFKLGSNAAQAGRRQYNWNCAVRQLNKAYNNLLNNQGCGDNVSRPVQPAP